MTCIHLVILTNDGRERSFPLQEGRAVIGREHRCDLRVPLSSVSGHHCEIIHADGTVEIKDLDSESGTFRNGDRIDRAILRDRDRISLGPVTFEIRFGPAAGRARNGRG